MVHKQEYLKISDKLILLGIAVKLVIHFMYRSLTTVNVLPSVLVQ